MPPRDPNREIDDFIARTDDSHARYVRLYNAVASASDATDLRKGLAVDAAFRLGSDWELFQHGWHIAAISKDPSKVIKEKLKELNSKLASVNGATAKVLGVPANFHSAKSRLTVAEIAELLDPTDRNITFSSVSDWLKNANTQLAPLYIAKVQAIDSNAEDACLVELLKSVRNAIAHGSNDSKARLNRAVRARPSAHEEGLVGDLNAPLIRGDSKYGIKDIGTYLNKWTGLAGCRQLPEGTRLSLLHNRIQDIANGLKSP